MTFQLTVRLLVLVYSLFSVLCSVSVSVSVSVRRTICKLQEGIYGPDSAGYSGFEYYSDEDHWHNFIEMDNVRDGWVQRIAAQHFVKSAVVLGGGCKHVTVADSSAGQVRTRSFPPFSIPK